MKPLHKSKLWLIAGGISLGIVFIMTFFIFDDLGDYLLSTEISNEIRPNESATSAFQIEEGQRELYSDNFPLVVSAEPEDVLIEIRLINYANISVEEIEEFQSFFTKTIDLSSNSTGFFYKITNKGDVDVEVTTNVINEVTEEGLYLAVIVGAIASILFVASIVFLVVGLRSYFKQKNENK